jgi:formyl-CoA transferase
MTATDKLPLHGIRVLDLTRALAGPFCAMILGDLGADVIKVEDLPTGDLIRNSPPFHEGESTYFLSVNRNKRSIAIDFRKPGALELLKSFAASVDVVVENFKPGVMEAMGLDYASLKGANPKLIFASVSGFGRTGPYGSLPGVDQIAQGMSGFMSVTGQPETGPTRVGIPIGDITAGMWLALSVQAAIIQRLTTGRGQRIDVSLLGSLVGLLCLQGQRYLSVGEIPDVAGNHHPVSSPYGTFTAQDGIFNFSATTPAMWQRLCTMLDMPDMANDPAYSTSAKRRANRAKLEQILNQRLAQRPKQEWIEKFRAAGLPAGPVYNMAEVFADPQVQNNRMVETIDHPKIGPLRQLASAMGLECFDQGSVRMPPPLLGQHTDEILRQFGVPRAQVEALVAAGTIRAA